MKLDKENLKKIASLPDDELWKTVHSIAKSHGVSLRENPPSADEITKLRQILNDSDKLNMFAAMKLINEYKRGR